VYAREHEREWPARSGWVSREVAPQHPVQRTWDQRCSHLRAPRLHGALAVLGHLVPQVVVGALDVQEQLALQDHAVHGEHALHGLADALHEAAHPERGTCRARRKGLCVSA
jgi:hypothetical protein